MVFKQKKNEKKKRSWLSQSCPNNANVEVRWSEVFLYQGGTVKRGRGCLFRSETNLSVGQGHHDVVP